MKAKDVKTWNDFLTELFPSTIEHLAIYIDKRIKIYKYHIYCLLFIVFCLLFTSYYLLFLIL